MIICMSTKPYEKYDRLYVCTNGSVIIVDTDLLFVMSPHADKLYVMHTQTVT